MVVTLLPIVTEVRPMQPEKADSPMVVTLLPIVTEVRPMQPLKAAPPIVVTLLGIMTSNRLEHSWYLQLIMFQFVVLKTVEKWLCRFC